MKQEVKILLWDLGGVLIPFSHEILWQNFLKLLPWHRRLFCALRKKVLFQKMHGALYDFEKGTINFEELLKALEENLGFHFEYQKALAAWNEIFGPIGETCRFALDLKEKYPSYILSNTNTAHLKYLFENRPELKNFTALFSSCELGVLKPSPEFYLKVLEKIGAAPTDCLFIDDREENVRSALDCGIPSLLYTNLPSLCVDFKDFGVEL